MKIIFMGSPTFALPSFRALVRSKYEIVAVYTKAPKPAGRGQKLQLSDIHLEAEKNGLLVHTPKTLRDKEVQAELFALNPDLIVVVAYGMILPEEILNYPRYGCINIHPSLLPRWRGAAPIQHTLWSGDQETAVCIMQMDAGLDSGPILAMEKFSLDNQITSGELHDKLAQIGANLLINTIRDIDNIAPQVQPTEGLTYATKISKEDAKIDWNRPALQINNLIRAFNPTPGAYFIYNDERIKLLKAQVIKGNFEQKTGTVIDEQLLISCQADGLRPLILQRAGRQPVSLEEFLRGYQVPRGAVLV